MNYPKHIRFVIERLRAHGFEAYLVGGALRDALLSREPGDFDVTTSALPTEMQAVFADQRVIETGLKHGTLTVLADGCPVEVTTYRIDGEYRDARHPESVRFTRSLGEDLARRDFTVNAMAYSEETGLVDLFGGREDLEGGIIRAVGDPETRFSEDALRILRAFRFASKLGFVIEPKTLAAIEKCKDGLLKISAERIAAELEGLLVGQNAYEALLLMKKSGVLTLVLPEAAVDKAVCTLPREFAVRLAYLLKNTEKEALSARLHALRLSNATIRSVTTLVWLSQGESLPTHEPEVRRLMAKSGELFEPFLAMLEANGLKVEPAREAAARIRARGDCLSVSHLALNGADLVALGYKGKAVGATLDLLLNAVLDDPTLNEKEKLIQCLKQEN